MESTTTKMRNQLGELVRMAVASGRTYGLVACEKADGSGLILTPYQPDFEPAIIVAKLGFTAALCRKEAGGQVMAVVMEGGTKRYEGDDPAVIERTAAEITASIHDEIPDPDVRESAVLIIASPDSPTEMWMAQTTRDDFGIVDLEWTDVSSVGRTPVLRKMCEVLEILAVHFPVVANVEAVSQIMGYVTLEVSYS